MSEVLWVVKLSRRTDRSLDFLPNPVKGALALLIRDIETSGPVRGDWPNYSRLGQRQHHCHLKKGRPTYVAVWEELDTEIRLVEVTYVGTHEKAPY